MAEAFKLRGEGKLRGGPLAAARLALNPKGPAITPGDNKIRDAVPRRGLLVHAVVRVGPAKRPQIVHYFIVQVALVFGLLLFQDRQGVNISKAKRLALCSP